MKNNIDALTEWPDKPLTRTEIERLLREAGSSDKLDLTNQNLQAINLRGFNLEGANLSKANLQGAILRDAALSRVLLREADLNGADLDRAILRGAYLTNANFIMVVPIVKTKLDQFSEKPKRSRGSQSATYFLPLLHPKYAELH